LACLDAVPSSTGDTSGVTTDQGAPQAEGDSTSAALDPYEPTAPTRSRWTSKQLRIVGILIVLIPDVMLDFTNGSLGVTDLFLVVPALVGWYLPMLAAILILGLGGLWTIVFGLLAVLSIGAWSWSASDVLQILLMLGLAYAGGLVFFTAARRKREEAAVAAAD
jgi:hypothetical protein